MTADAKKLISAVSLVWTAIIAKWFIYGAISKVSVGTPPIAISLVLYAVLIGAAIYVTYAGVKKVVFGPRRLIGVALIFLALTPAIWSTLFIVELRYSAGFAVMTEGEIQAEILKMDELAKELSWPTRPWWIQYQWPIAIAFPLLSLTFSFFGCRTSQESTAVVT